MNDNGLDFSMVIASVVHDMKNSLSTLMHAHSQWLMQLTKVQQDVPEHGAIEYEFAHLNGMLVQLLGLYKLGVNQLPLRPDYHELDDFIEALLACHQDVLHSHGLVANYEVQGFDELGFFDRELISSVVANIIINAVRYARHAILITAHEEDGQLVLTVNDDGPGYPAQMLERQSDYLHGINQSSGSTGLGLYFAARIAERHERNGVRGHIELANGGKLGGGNFSLYLP
ncbi:MULTISPECIES: HAMP domain-containing sensor histidine kinase [unclassified Pseudomonas]|uniref:sensor histidine kinase n=1 Tax=unclassified Pseudomonas TaxID=196821 RepID=UPI002AC8E198|nr:MULTISPECIES: HAMP domain-containing sensor histidine kinase [unclassified Pseudomonas]MEB0041108.1 HAMP domain-containing sensor histidine kinase [Pseudomonas sp. MH10]MEB0078555.1 HAMP domain-containing sensor histidine kinase [Pseudomonas sp. MH10out]MEB0092145.1 HAMP domain-containing sensor histidine kinase [Pseudomonas sp. CCI4.2]MEB0100370.1 HAMP domain-containing sensor histidine kinase [Pseudomonas sp. CCI3.2]MEB0120292.1 HAMP domain-containing sensor histidine kinase [Pseudomonas 